MSYLYHLQILLFFNLQDTSPSDNVLLSTKLWLNLRCYNYNDNSTPKTTHKIKRPIVTVDKIN